MAINIFAEVQAERLRSWGDKMISFPAILLQVEVHSSLVLI
jgi:hypothetical protein